MVIDFVYQRYMSLDSNKVIMICNIVVSFSDTSQLKLDKTGFLAAIPYLAMAIVVQCGGQLADWLRSRWKVGTTKVIPETFYLEK